MDHSYTKMDEDLPYKRELNPQHLSSLGGGDDNDECLFDDEESSEPLFDDSSSSNGAASEKMEEDAKLFSDDSSSDEEEEKPCKISSPPSRHHPNDPRYHMNDPRANRSPIAPNSPTTENNTSTATTTNTTTSSTTTNQQPRSSLIANMPHQPPPIMGKKIAAFQEKNNSDSNTLPSSSLISNMPRQPSPLMEKKLSALMNNNNNQDDVKVENSTSTFATTRTSLISNMPHQSPPPIEKKLQKLDHETDINSNYNSNNNNNNNNNVIYQSSPTRYKKSENDILHQRTTSPNSSQPNTVEITEESSTTLSPVTTHPPFICQPTVDDKSKPDPNIVHILDVEWASDSSGPEIAHKPTFDWSDDPCGCTPDGTGQKCCVDLSCVLFACQEECRSNCEAGALCGNQRITKKQYKKVEVIDAGKKGRGLKVLEPIKKYDFIIEYVGVAVKKKYLDNLFARYRNERMLYIMGLDNDVYLDARKKGGIARYINHSCDPNCAVHRWKVNGVSRAGIFAVRDIEVGEELGFDYKWDRKRGRAPTKCYCMAKNCRGTLEMPRETTIEDEELETQLMGHWKVPKSYKADHSIINRTIKIYFDGDHEYFVADVAKYDEKTGKHCIMYRQDHDEHWEDLSKEQWMILDEEMEQFVIARKQKRRLEDEQMLQATDAKKIKNWVIVQTPMKSEILRLHLVDRCQRHYRVQIHVSRCVSSMDPDEEEDEEAKEENEALQKSLDGTAWKFSISGMHPEAARNYLLLNVNEIVKKKEIIGRTIEVEQEKIRLEIVIPRCIVDHVKVRLNIMRSTCKNVEVRFTHSDSISKQFAKLIIEGTQQVDVLKAQTILWKEVLTMCHGVKAPLTPNGLFKDFGFLGGKLSYDEFRLLFNNAARNLKHSCCEYLSDSPFFATFQETNRCTIWVQSEEDMGRINSKNQIINGAVDSKVRKIFFGCEPKRIPDLWSLLKTRANELKRGVRFFNYGIDRLYHNQIQRTFDKRLGLPWNNFFDFIAATTSVQVKEDFVTKNHLRIDGKGVGSDDVVNIDGTEQNELECRVRLAEELIKLQIELYRDNRIRQQRWCFGRDWTIFVQKPKANKSLIQTDDNSSGTSTSRPLSPRPGVSSSTRSVTDSRSIASACFDIADMTAHLNLDQSIAAHGCIILYRYLHQVSKKDTNNITSTLKLREYSIACLFLATKCQKAHKWKRLEIILEAAYKQFYPAATFDPNDEQSLVWEKRILAAENEILKVLEHDVFWSGVEWILVTAVDSGQMSQQMANNTMEIALSGISLSAGPLLWLKFGPKYAFACIAGLLSNPIEPLIAALSLVPRQLSEALEAIVLSIDSQPSNKALPIRLKSNSSAREIFKGGTKSLQSTIDSIHQICKTHHAPYPRSSTPLFGMAKQNQITARRSCRRRQIRSIDKRIIRDKISPQVEKISSESQCSVFLEKGADLFSEDIVMEGSWRSISFAEHLLRQQVADDPEQDSPAMNGISKETSESKGDSSTLIAFQNPIDRSKPATHVDTPQNVNLTNPLLTASSPDQLPPSVDLGAFQSSLLKFQPKMVPGTVKVSELDGSVGWEGTNESYWPGKIGGKTCIAARAPEKVFHNAGLRWWIPKRYCPSLSGSICDMFAIRNNGTTEDADHVDSLARIARHLTSKNDQNDELFPFLNSLGPDNGVSIMENETKSCPVAISLQRWPTEKMEARERSKGGMEVGFSPSALQEMQLLHQLHHMIPSPQGHPNFVLPIALALADENEEEKPSEGYKSDELFLLRMTGEITDSIKESKEPRNVLSGSYMVFHPTPIILQRIMGKGKKKVSGESKVEPSIVIPPSIFSAWFHDMLSAIAHCHANHVILRTLHPDQILIDQSGVAKLSGLSRCMVLHPDDRGRYHDPMKSIKSRSKGVTEDDVRSNPYMAPELLLGATQYTQETDIWTLGCLMAHLLLNKPIFSGRERVSKMRAIFKIVGMPSKTNYNDATLYPHFDVCKPPTKPGKPDKKYKKDVEKALRYILNQSDINADEYSGALRLLERMLDLDPKKRISAADALEHEYMVDFVNNSTSETFQKTFVQDWIDLKEKIFLKNRNGAEDGSDFSHLHQKDLKRKMLLMEAASGTFNVGENDDLYDIDDIIMSGASKKRKKVP